MNPFAQLVCDTRNSGKKQIVIRSSQDLAWKSGFAAFLMLHYETRKLGHGDDFVAYI